jgi:uncharacterized protein (TIGR03118 family)
MMREHKWFYLALLVFWCESTAVPRADAEGYKQTNLISNIPGLAESTDPTLLNPWGVAFFPGASPFWVNDNNAGFSALYVGSGAPFPGLPLVTIPSPTAATGGTPTGIVANFFVGSGAFPIPNPAGGGFGPSLFIFSTEDGTIEGWNINPPVAPGIPNPLTAVTIVDNSAGGGPTGAVYKGLALEANATNGPLLYATNFRTGTVDVFDTSFHQVTLSGSFTDPRLQHGYAPFGIQAIDGQLWVTYAMQDKAKHDPVTKPAHGFVSVFDTDGNLLQHFAQHGHLSSPWGVALAPASFGEFADDILIGNFGDGRINAYDPASGRWLGTVAGPDGKPLVNDGLWALTFSGPSGMTPAGATPDTLYFTAGLNDEADGLFGAIAPN